MLRIIKKTWKFYLAILAPTFLSIIPLTWKGGTTGKEPYAAFVICLMGIYWMTECVPIPVTSFLPVVLFPLFGILSTDRVTSVYLQDSLLFLLGGCIIALSFEYSNLHTRIALKVMMLVGTQISQLLLGIMMTTMVLSMWMNNTSTTAMMVPIVNALIDELKTKMQANVTRRSSQGYTENIEMSTICTSDANYEDCKEIDVKKENCLSAEHKNVEKHVRRMRIMFLLGTAYASNIGGTGVITGSATNLIALDLVRKDSEESSTAIECRNILEISFLDWMLFNVPPMLLNTIFCYLYLLVHFMGISNKYKFWKQKSTERFTTGRKSLEKGIKHAITEKYEALGPVTLHEWAILTFFGVMVFLWIFKDPQFMPGWDSLFKKTAKGKSYIKEATPTLLITILMFTFPSKLEYFSKFRNGGLAQGLKDPLLNWSFVQEKFPWGIFMLLGGGASMALGAKESGLNQWLGAILASSDLLHSLSSIVLLTLVLLLIAVLTTVASNTAVAAIVTPILLGMAYAKDIHPLFLVLPAASVCSYAFILPVSTPPNAIVYSAGGDIELRDMMLPGFAINVISIVVIIITTRTTSEWIFGFTSYQNQCRNMTQISST